MTKDYLKLHFIILIWGFTGILGALISLDAVQLVFWRTFIACIALVVWIAFKKTGMKVSRADALKLIGTGLVVGSHWMFFFSAVKVGGASIGMVGLSTSALWAAFMSPFFTKQKVSWLEIAFGVLVVLALSLIAQADFSKVYGLILSIIAAFLAALFSFFNASFTKRLHHHTIALYELGGACLVSLLALPFFAHERAILPIPGLHDWLYLLALSLLCTVYPYSECVEIMKRISVFVTNLSVNLEPVYGIILAAFLLGEHHFLTRQFYVGATVICLSVFLYPLLRVKLKI